MGFEYLFALTDGGGTLPPELGVVRRLVRRGHRVRVIADASALDAAARTGAEVLALPSMAADVEPGYVAYRDWEIKSPWKLAQGMADHMLVGPAPAHAHAVSRAITDLAPDLVVASSTNLGAMLAAEAREVPFDVLIPNIYPMPAPGMPPMGPGLRPARGPLGRVRDRLINQVSTRMLSRYVLPRLNALRAEYQLGPVSSHWEQVHRGRRELILTSAAFDFPASLPSTARYVGPILDDPTWAANSGWSAPPGSQPLVLVAMSSTFQGHHDVLQRICDALVGQPLRALVTTGPALDPADLSAPENVTVAQAAPHTAVLQEASLVVTHGGHGTVMKSLAAGVPMVVISHGRDQADNATRVRLRGAGVSIPQNSSTRRIRQAINHVINSPAASTAAQALGKAIRHDAQSPDLLDELEKLPHK